MFQLADHLDCPRLMESCVQAIEKSKGANMLQASYGSSGALHWLLLSEKYGLEEFKVRSALVACHIGWCERRSQHC